MHAIAKRWYERNARRSYLNVEEFYVLLLSAYSSLLWGKWKYLNGALLWLAVGFTLLPYGVPFQMYSKYIYPKTFSQLHFVRIKHGKVLQSWDSDSFEKVSTWKGICEGTISNYFIKLYNLKPASAKSESERIERKKASENGAEERRFEAKHVDWPHFVWLWWSEEKTQRELEEENIRASFLSLQHPPRSEIHPQGCRWESGGEQKP